jgi:L-lysine exporter family protein LysE/ArgO
MPFNTFATAFSPAFSAGFLLSLSTIMALGPQNVHVMRMGLRGQHVWLTVGLCVASDALLISLGVLGMGKLMSGAALLQTAFMALGIVFLLVYGARAFARFRSGASEDTTALQGFGTGAMTRRQATLAALGFTWLNPHAWLDTIVLIGAASLAWHAPSNVAFGIGAASGSVVWFIGLALCVLWVGKRLQSPGLWRALDGLVALMMWGTALMLAVNLLRG